MGSRVARGVRRVSLVRSGHRSVVGHTVMHALAWRLWDGGLLLLGGHLRLGLELRLGLWLWLRWRRRLLLLLLSLRLGQHPLKEVKGLGECCGVHPRHVLGEHVQELLLLWL